MGGARHRRWPHRAATDHTGRRYWTSVRGEWARGVWDAAPVMLPTACAGRADARGRPVAGRASAGAPPPAATERGAVLTRLRMVDRARAGRRGPAPGARAPAVPLTAALRHTGHDVLVAAGSHAEHLGGLPAHDLAPGFRLDRAALRVLPAHPSSAAASCRARRQPGASSCCSARSTSVCSVGWRNVRPVSWRPLPAVLPHADPVVQHGGAGTVLAAPACGCPSW